jgi:hypothetical protein
VGYSCKLQPLLTWFKACYGGLDWNVGWLNPSGVPGMLVGEAPIMLGSGFPTVFT